MRVCLFEDRGALDLEPLSLTRPVFELLCGLTSLAAKQSRFFPPGPRGVLIRPSLADLVRLSSTALPVNDLAWLRAGPTILVNGRWLPPSMPLPIAELAGPCVGLVNDEVVFAVLEPEHLADCSANTLDDCLATWKTTLPNRPVGGRLIRYLWELVQHNGEQILADWQTAGPPFEAQPADAEHPGLAIVGPREQLVLHPTAHLEPMIVADTTRGPIVIDRNAVVTAFTRLEGPCSIGPGTQVQGAKVRAGTTLGPDCRIGGEVECSIVQGHSNKYHDGFLGHAYIGEWVNLGAGTQNSDLRNDYGEITVTVNGRLVRHGTDEGRLFPRRSHEDRPRHVAEHRHQRRGLLQSAAGRPAAALCPLVRQLVERASVGSCRVGRPAADGGRGHATPSRRLHRDARRAVSRAVRADRRGAPSRRSPGRIARAAAQRVIRPSLRRMR